METVRPGAPPSPVLCVVLHVGYMGEWPFYESYLTNLRGIPHDLVVTVSDAQWTSEIPAVFARFHEKLLASSGRSGDDRLPGAVTVLPVENRGLDAGGWIAAMGRLLAGGRIPAYDYVLKVHTKSPRHLGPGWRIALMDSLLRSPERARACMRILDRRPDVGMLGCAGWIMDRARDAADHPLDVAGLAARMDVPLRATAPGFIGGTMFWARFAPLARPFVGKDPERLLRLFPPGFPPGESEAHAMERMFADLVATEGLRIEGVPSAADPALDSVQSDNVMPTEELIAADRLERAYELAMVMPHSLGGHMQTLHDRASRCDSVVQLGPADSWGAWAFARGLARCGAADVLSGQPVTRPTGCAGRRLAIVWPERHPLGERLAGVCARIGLPFAHVRAEPAAEPVGHTDMLFVDGWHVYGQVRRELASHHERVGRWIVLHDTDYYGEHSEVALRGAVDAEAARIGWPKEDVARGIWPAVVDFLEGSRGTWRLADKWTHCYGMAVLERCCQPVAFPCSPAIPATVLGELSALCERHARLGFPLVVAPVHRSRPAVDGGGGETPASVDAVATKPPSAPDAGTGAQAGA